MGLACLCTVRLHTKLAAGTRAARWPGRHAVLPPVPGSSPSCAGVGLEAPLSASISRGPAGSLAGAGFVPVTALRGGGAWGGLCSAVNVPGGLGVLSPTPGGLELLLLFLPLAAAPSDASFPQRWGAAGTRWAAGTGCCPAPARPEGPPEGVSRADAVGGSQVPIANGMRSGAKCGCL